MLHSAEGRRIDRAIAAVIPRGGEGIEVDGPVTIRPEGEPRRPWTRMTDYRVKPTMR